MNSYNYVVNHHERTYIKIITSQLYIKLLKDQIMWLQSEVQHKNLVINTLGPTVNHVNNTPVVVPPVSDEVTKASNSDLVYNVDESNITFCSKKN